MPSIFSKYPSKYFKAEDFSDGPRVLIIERLADEPLGKTQEIKPVVYFVGEIKGFVLNRTNANKITKLLGTDQYEAWTGRSICLYATIIDMNGEETPAIRVKAAPLSAVQPNKAKARSIASTPSASTAIDEETFDDLTDDEVGF